MMKRILLILAVLLVMLLSCNSAEANLTFITGTHLIDYNVYDFDEWGNVSVKSSASVIVAPGAILNTLSLQDYASGIMIGGQMQGQLNLFGEAAFELEDGEIWGDILVQYDSNLVMRGVEVGGGITLRNNAEVDVTDGSFGAGISVNDFSYAYVCGGKVVGTLYSNSPHTLVLEGTEFTVDFEEVSGDYSILANEAGVLRGTLSDGNSLLNAFETGDQGHILLTSGSSEPQVNPIPAPGSLMLASVGVLMVGLLRRRNL